MENESTVYWAPPYEIGALRNTSKNMVTNNLVKTRLILEKIIDNINSGEKVGIKIHAGESYNTRYLRHDYVREVVKFIKSKGGIPALIETQGLGLNPGQVNISEDYSICLGRRKTAAEHAKIAHLHGYTESIVGAPIKFIDGENGLDGKIIEIDGIHFKKVSVAAGLDKFDKIVVISHFKGHAQAGFGGALKQLGIGCITKFSKFNAHTDGSYKINKRRCDISKCAQECVKTCPSDAIKIEGESAVIDDFSCFGCHLCVKACPIKRAIKPGRFKNVKEFVECVMDNAAAVLKTFSPDNFRYINFALDIVLQCDCVPNPSMPVVPDLGIFGSSDPVAIDKACVDAETNAPGLPVLKKDGQWTEPLLPGVEKFKSMLSLIDPSYQFDAAIINKIGNTKYNLINILE